MHGSDFSNSGVALPEITQKGLCLLNPFPFSTTPNHFKPANIFPGALLSSATVIKCLRSCAVLGPWSQRGGAAGQSTHSSSPYQFRSVCCRPCHLWPS